MKKFIEPALALGLVISLIIGARAESMQQDISGRVLRLHVIANSDNEIDQAEKLRVRDQILKKADMLLNSANSVDEVKTIISDNLNEFTIAAKSATKKHVKAELVTMYFPTREYDNFTLPAGKYEALRIIIGEGKGRNWWCVMFPPLCISASEAMHKARDAGISADEIDLISKGENTYQYKFKFLEILSKIKDTLF